MPNPPPRRADLASRRSAAAQHDHSLWPHAAYPGGYAAREPAHGCGLWSDTGRWVSFREPLGQHVLADLARSCERGRVDVTPVTGVLQKARCGAADVWDSSPPGKLYQPTSKRLHGIDDANHDRQHDRTIVTDTDHRDHCGVPLRWLSTARRAAIRTAPSSATGVPTQTSIALTHRAPDDRGQARCVQVVDRPHPAAPR